MYNGKNVLTGSDSYTSNAFLELELPSDGENCTLLETTLINPTVPGGGSSMDMSLIPPISLVSILHMTTATVLARVACQVNNINLVVAFCAEASQLVAQNPTTAAVNATSSLPPSSIPTSVSTPSGTPSSDPSGSAPTPTVTHVNINDPGCEEPAPTPSVPTYMPMPSSTEGLSDPRCEEPALATDSNAPTVMPAPTTTSVGGVFDPAESDPGCEDPQLVTTSLTALAPASASAAPTNAPSGDPSDPGCEESQPEPTTTTSGTASAPTPSTTDDPNDPNCEELEPATSGPAGHPHPPQHPLALTRVLPRRQYPR
ncbi:hypothetical protein JVU11DRAFT_9493 [Chiua virens]|nr:hypothetical protein JVU11DRAFT_9493 [Chiua virens]